MKAYGIILASALALALTACGDSGGSGGGLGVLTGGDDPQQPANPANPGNDDPQQPANPINPGSDNPQLPANPINPGTDNPQQPANPGTPGSPTTTTGAGELPAEFLNGPDLNNFTSFWLCENVGETDAENFFSMRFLENGMGAYGGGGEILEFSWSATGNTVDFAIQGDSRNFSFANIQFGDQFSYNTEFEITDEASQPTICALYGLDDQPFGNVLPSHGGTQTTADDPPSGGTGSIDELLLNGVAGDGSLTDVWDCSTDSGQFAIAFAPGGDGAVAPGPNGADEAAIQWAISGDSVVFSIITTADSIIGGIVFSGQNNFTSETANLAGNDFGGASCERVANE